MDLLRVSVGGEVPYLISGGSLGRTYPGHLILPITERVLVASPLFGEEIFVGSGLGGFLTILDLTYLIPLAVWHLLRLKHRT